MAAIPLPEPDHRPGTSSTARFGPLWVRSGYGYARGVSHTSLTT